jgi:hypothetical protein
MAEIRTGHLTITNLVSLPLDQPARCVLLLLYCCDMTPESRSSGARGDLIAWQRLGKQNTQATLDMLLETIFSIRSMQKGHKRRELRFGS